MLPIAKLPSGTGAQVNVLGLAGVAVGLEEGAEVNLLGLTFGIDPVHLALKLPIIGSIGPKRFAEQGAARPPLDAPQGPAAAD